MLQRAWKVRQGRVPTPTLARSLQDSAARLAALHCCARSSSLAHLSRYERSRESPRSFKIPAASSIWRCDCPSFAHSNLARIMSSALATCKGTPSISDNRRLPNSSWLNARDLRMITFPRSLEVDDVEQRLALESF